MDAYAADPAGFDPGVFMNALNVLESRGYTTAFFDGPVGPSAHDYETTRSSSDYHAAGVITAVDTETVTLELRNELRTGDTIEFILPHTISNVRVTLPQIINARSGETLPKMSAGQHNSITIPRTWIHTVVPEKFVPYVLAFKKK